MHKLFLLCFNSYIYRYTPCGFKWGVVTWVVHLYVDESTDTDSRLTRKNVWHFLNHQFSRNEHHQKVNVKIWIKFKNLSSFMFDFKGTHLIPSIREDIITIYIYRNLLALNAKFSRMSKFHTTYSTNQRIGVFEVK